MAFRHIARILAGMLVLLAAALPGTGLAQLGTWSAKAPMPTPRSGAAAASLDGLIYVAGGYQGGVACTYLNVVEAYDPATNTWTTRAPLPYRPDATAGLVISGVLYVVGGLTGCGSSFDNLVAYNSTTNTWASKAPMPTARGALGVGAINGILYAVGGNRGNQVVGTLEAYDPSTNTWSTKAPMPTPRMGATVAVADGLLYAIGGFTGSAGSAAVEAYNPATNTWSTKASISLARTSPAAAALGGRIYVAGGGYNVPASSLLESYDSTADRWSTLAPMPTARGALTLAAHGTALYAFGGYDASGVKSANEMFVPAAASYSLSVSLSGSGSVVSSPVGISCPSACSASFNAGTSVTLSASSAAGSVFAGWSGACSGTASCTVTIDAAKSVTATFNALPSSLSVTPASVDFGSRTMGSTSPSQTVTITNTGGAAATISAITASTDFAVTHDCSALAVGASCRASVRFTPSTQTVVAGALDIAGSAGGKSVALTGGGERSLVVHYYDTILRRPPDAGGKAFWELEAIRMQKLGVGINETWFAMSSSFFFSPEYAALQRDNSGFITDLYRTFFNRLPDGAGLGFWAGQLDAGMPREVALAAFVFSPEFVGFTDALFGRAGARKEAETVMDFYRGLLARLPDDGGFGSWVARFRDAQCAGNVYGEVEAISAAFVNSPEFAARKRTNEQFVGDLYNAFLRRGGDLGGVKFWIGQLDGGSLSRDQVRRKFLESAEFSARVTAVLAEGCLTDATLLEGSYRFGGTYPSPGPVTYTAGDGSSITYERAYPGFVLLDSSVTSEQSVAALLQPYGAAIVAAIPRVGQYTVRVPDSGAFITAVKGLAWVDGVWPVQPIEQGSRLLALDSKAWLSLSSCSRNHADYVVDIMSRRSSVGGSYVDVGGRDGLEISWELGYQMYQAERAGQRLVVNISMQSAASGPPCQTLEKCQSAAQGQYDFLRTVVKMMQINANVQRGRADNTLVTVIAGNAGAELDLQLKLLKVLYPQGFERVVVVGGTTPSQVVDKRFNFLRDAVSRDMVYARSDDVPVGGTTCDGTSFAGPEVASVLDYVWSKRPDLRSAQVLSALRDALQANGTALIPQDANGRTPQAFLDQVLSKLPPQTPCTVAVSPSGDNLPAAGSNGSIVLTVPTGCSWSVTSSQPWLTVISSTTGTGSGTVTYSVPANAGSVTRFAMLTFTTKDGNATFTVTQPGAPSAPPCAATISPSSVSPPAQGMSGSVNVTAPVGCSWSVSSSQSWVTVTSAATGTGNGTFNYTVSANGDSAARSATLAVAAKDGTVTFAITQAGTPAGPPTVGSWGGSWNYTTSASGGFTCSGTWNGSLSSTGSVVMGLAGNCSYGSGTSGRWEGQISNAGTGTLAQQLWASTDWPLPEDDCLYLSVQFSAQSMSGSGTCVRSYGTSQLSVSGTPK